MESQELEQASMPCCCTTAQSTLGGNHLRNDDDHCEHPIGFHEQKLTSDTLHNIHNNHHQNTHCCISSLDNAMQEEQDYSHHIATTTTAATTTICSHNNSSSHHHHHRKHGRRRRPEGIRETLSSSSSTRQNRRRCFSTRSGWSQLIILLSVFDQVSHVWSVPTAVPLLISEAPSSSPSVVPGSHLIFNQTHNNNNTNSSSNANTTSTIIPISPASLPTGIPTRTIQPSPRPSRLIPELDFFPSLAPTMTFSFQPTKGVPTLNQTTTKTNAPTTRERQQRSLSPTTSNVLETTVTPTRTSGEAVSSPTAAPSLSIGEHPSIAPQLVSSTMPSFQQQPTKHPSFVIIIRPVVPTTSPPTQVPVSPPTGFTESPTHSVGDTSSAPFIAPHPTSIIFPNFSESPSSAPTISLPLQPTQLPSPTKPPSLPRDGLTPAPTQRPTKRPTMFPQLFLEPPSAAPTLGNSDGPTESIPLIDTAVPTPTVGETSSPPFAFPMFTKYPTFRPTTFRFFSPSAAPTLAHSDFPQVEPTLVPSPSLPTDPTMSPTHSVGETSTSPVVFPPFVLSTRRPTIRPTTFPQSFGGLPSAAPTLAHSPFPQEEPTLLPSHALPTDPTASPTHSVGETSTGPAELPSSRPTLGPPSKRRPTPFPQWDSSPSSAPTIAHSPFPQFDTTTSPSKFPSAVPTIAHSAFPQFATKSPSKAPVRPTRHSRTATPTRSFGETSTIPIAFPTSETPSSITPPPSRQPHFPVPFLIPIVAPTTVPVVSPTSQPVLETTPTTKPVTTGPTLGPVAAPAPDPTSPSKPTDSPHVDTSPTAAPTVLPAPHHSPFVFPPFTKPTSAPESSTSPSPSPTGIPSSTVLLPSAASRSPSKRPNLSPSPRETIEPTRSEITGGVFPFPLPTGFPTITPSILSKPSVISTPTDRPHLSPVANTAAPTREGSNSPVSLPTGIPTLTGFPQAFSWPSPAPTIALPVSPPEPSPSGLLSLLPLPTSESPSGLTSLSPSPTSAPTLAQDPTTPGTPTSEQTSAPTRTFAPTRTMAPTRTSLEASSAPFPIPPQLAPFRIPVRRSSSPQKTSVRTPTAPSSPQKQPVTPPTQAPITEQPTSSPSVAPVITLSPSAYPTIQHRANPRYDLETLLLPGAKMLLLGALPLDTKARDHWLTITKNRIAAEVVATLTGNLESVNVMLNITALTPPITEGGRQLNDVAVKGNRQLVQTTSNVRIVFDVSIFLRSALTTNPQDLMNYVGGGFQTAQDLNNYLLALRSTNDTAFANVYNMTLSLPFITSVNGGIGNNEGGPNRAGLIAGLVVASIVSVAALALFFYFHRQPRVGTAEEKEEIGRNSETMAAPNSSDGHEITSEINLELKADVSTLGDPTIGPNVVAGGPDQSSADSFSLDFDFQRAYHRNENGSASESNDSNSNMMVLKDDDTFDLQYYSEEQFEVDAPAGMLGLVLETSADGVPTVHAIKHTSPLVDQVRVGDRLLSVDGENVTIMLASDVSRLIASRRDNDVRRFVFSRSPDQDNHVAPNDHHDLRPPSP